MNAEANKNIFLRYDYHSHTSVKNKLKCKISEYKHEYHWKIELGKYGILVQNREILGENRITGLWVKCHYEIWDIAG